MKDNIKFVLWVITLVSVIVASWGLGLNQFAAFLDRGQDARLEQAQAECLRVDSPHALIVEGVTYCYLAYMGTEIVLPLEEIQRRYQQSQPNPEGSG